MLSTLTRSLKSLQNASQRDDAALTRYTRILKHIETRPSSLLARAFLNLYA